MLHFHTKTEIVWNPSYNFRGLIFLIFQKNKKKNKKQKLRTMIQPHRQRIILIEIDRAEQRWIARKLEEEEKYQPKKKKMKI